MTGSSTLRLFQEVLGPAFEHLPEPIRTLHAVTSWTNAEGRCTVSGGRNVLARLAARLLSLPPQCRDEKIQVLIRRRHDHEVWTRIIAGKRFVSRLRASGQGRVTERIGPVDYDFELVPDATTLSMVLRAVRVLGISVPRRVWPQIAAEMSVAEGSYRFDIATSLPGIGPVVSYGGTLSTVEERTGIFPGRPVVLFDGICNFCNASINFLLRWDPDGVIRFSAMQSETGRRLLKRHGLSERDFETFIVLDGDQVLAKTAAIVHLARYLGPPWRLASTFLLVPQALRDGAYDLIARNRYKLMGKRMSCRVPSSEERERFLD